MQDRLLAIGMQSLADDAFLDVTNLFFVEPAGLVLAIACDERHGVAGIEQADDGRHARLLQSKAVRNLLKVDRRRGWHRGGNPERYRASLAVSMQLHAQVELIDLAI